MKVQEHIDKISWSFLDKIIFLAYGLVNLYQFNYLDSVELGLFALLLYINNWFFMISDGFTLQGMIQYGINESNRKKVNLMSLALHTGFTLGASLLYFAFRHPISDLFNEPRLVEIGLLLPLLALINIPRTYTIKLLFREQDLKKVFFSDLFNFGTMTIITFIIVFQNGALFFEDMIFIFFGGTIAGSAAGILLSLDKLKFSMRGDISLSKYTRFGSKMMVQNIFHSLPKNLDVYIVQFFFGSSIVGLYHSAKTLFRVFDEALNASYGLVYPSAVRQIENNNIEELKALMTKAFSFMFLAFAVCVIALEAGLAAFIFEYFLPSSYLPALSQYKVMLLTALVLPFTMLSLIITASGKPGRIMIFSGISSILSLVAFYISGVLQNPDLVPIGLITYNVFFGIMCYIYLKRTIGFPIKMLFRAVGDSVNFYKAFRSKEKK